MSEAETPRWFGPEGSTRYHYFDESLRSLCGKWMLWATPQAAGMDWGMAQGSANGDCLACSRALAKLQGATT